MKKYEDQFKYIGNNESIKLISESYPVWIITDFGYRINSNEIMFIVQPITKEGGLEGFTGLHVYILTKKQFLKHFQKI